VRGLGGLFSGSINHFTGHPEVNGSIPVKDDNLSRPTCQLIVDVVM
jgi:hypothetical protein